MSRDRDLTSADLRFYVALASAPSLAAASRALDVSRSAVTQCLAQLELRLRCRLLDRSRRRVRLTTEGELLLARGQAMLADLDELTGQLSARREVVSGHLRVAAPLGFGRRYIAPVVALYKERYPGVPVTLTLTDHPATATEDNWDVIVHIGELRSSSLVMPLRAMPTTQNLSGSRSEAARL